MSTWRNSILSDLVPGTEKITLVDDPDRLLCEEDLVIQLKERGFQVIVFDDPVAFRYALESQYKMEWENGDVSELIVTFHNGVDSIPYDLTRYGSIRHFNLSDLFPNLSYSILEELDLHWLDSLSTASQSTKRLGDDATKDYLLRNVFQIDPELISSKVDILRTLLRIHFSNVNIPQVLIDRLATCLEKSPCTHEWSLHRILSDRSAFYDFLQGRWQSFIKELADHQADTQYNDKGSLAADSLRGPGFSNRRAINDIPFEHNDIRVYIDNLFIEGQLTPIIPPDSLRGLDSWVQVGLVAESSEETQLSLNKLYSHVENSLPVPNQAQHNDWTVFAQRWAELSNQAYRTNSFSEDRFMRIGDRVQTHFSEWLIRHYAGLVNLPPTSPAMVHHISRHIARSIESSQDGRAALLVVDGLSMSQWLDVHHVIREEVPDWSVDNHPIFAWVPTLTSVSRQSIFSGTPPLYFSSSINSTSKEESLWKRFWEEHGLKRQDIAYQRGLGDGDAENDLDEVLHPNTRIVGLVINTVDKIMHGMHGGVSGMHLMINQWSRGGYLTSLIDILLQNRFQVWLTSDHGNIECIGCGRPSEGSIAETKGERVRVYPTPQLRSRMSNELPDAIVWPSIGLPSDYSPLLAAGNTAFIKKGERTVGHGGISIEEVIVPFVKIEHRSR